MATLDQLYRADGKYTPEQVNAIRQRAMEVGNYYTSVPGNYYGGSGMGVAHGWAPPGPNEMALTNQFNAQRPDLFNSKNINKGGIGDIIGKGVEYGTEAAVIGGIGAGLAGVAGVGPAAASSGAAPAAAPAGTISGTGLSGATGTGALTASTPTALTAGGTGTSIAAGGSGALPAATTGAAPFWTSSSALVPAAIGGSAVLGYFGSKEAAGKQADSAEAARKLIEQQNAQSRTDLAPWRTSGTLADAELMKRLGIGTPGGANFGSLLKPFTMADLSNEPGYQFGLSEGEKGIDRAAAAGSGRYSGATLKALTRFNENYAGTKYDAAFGRDDATKRREYSMLSGVSGQGENAAGMTAGLGTNAAVNGGNFLTQAGNADASGTIGGINAVTGAVNTGLNYYQNQQLLNSLGNSRGTGVQPYTMR